MPADRRQFHRTIVVGGAALAGGIAVSEAAEPQKAFERDYPKPQFTPAKKNPPLPAQLVEDFVLFAHYDLDMVKTLLEREPKLAAAAVDWGAGDWETGLGGASHLGRRDIAEFLLGRGARMDVFCAAMLGQLDAVKGMLAAAPKLIEAKGPHGFTLHHHARVGGDAAKGVLEFLLAQGPEPAGPKMPGKK